MVKGDSKDQISRSEWVNSFKEGYKHGQKERHRDPENRRNDIGEALGDTEHSEPQLEALQAGYEIGRDQWHPGCDIEIEQKANSAYDRSGYGQGLGEWA